MKTNFKELAPDWQLLLVALIIFIVTLVASVPAGVAAWFAQKNSPLLTISNASGTLWNAKFEGVSYNRIALGDVTAKIQPIALVAGRLTADVTSSGGALAANGRIELTSSRLSVRRMKAEFNLGAIRRYTFFGARYQGVARLDAKFLSLSRSGCKSDGAIVTTNALDSLAKKWSGAGFPLKGPVLCENGLMNLRLAGDSREGAATINVSVKPDLSFTMIASAEPKRREVSKTLELFGFRPRAGKLSYEAAGVLKGVGS